VLFSAFATVIALLGSAHPVYAQGKPQELDGVTVTALRNPVDKSYRRMVLGMELFEKHHHLAPDAAFGSFAP